MPSPAASDAHTIGYDGAVAKQTVTIRMEPAVLLRIQREAERVNRSVSQWIALAAERVIDDTERTNARGGRR